MDIKEIRLLDITAPQHAVEVEMDWTRMVLYVHVDGITALRVCRIPAFKFSRKGKPIKKKDK